ncbi:uncharacterized protein ACIB01_012136 [Guaruba guarouba]
MILSSRHFRKTLFIPGLRSGSKVPPAPELQSRHLCDAAAVLKQEELLKKSFSLVMVGLELCKSAYSAGPSSLTALLLSVLSSHSRGCSHCNGSLVTPQLEGMGRKKLLQILRFVYH